MQDTGDKGEKNGEEKKEKDYISHQFSMKAVTINKKTFCLHSAEDCTSPDLDYASPPPDFNL